MTCFGFSTSLTPSKSDYDTSPELYMYRAYNGATYAKGVAGKSLAKFHENDVIAFEAGNAEQDLYIILVHRESLWHTSSFF